MRDPSTSLFQYITNIVNSGSMVGQNSPVGRVTLSRNQIQPFYTPRGTWRSYRKQTAFPLVDTRATYPELEVPNIQTITIDRRLDQSVGTCEIVLMNTAMTSPEFDDFGVGNPGYYTFNRGAEVKDYSAGFQPQKNTWYDLLRPNRIIHTYQGYGTDDATRFDPSNPLYVPPWSDSKLYQTGVWVIDSVTLNAPSATLTITCRDVGKFLVEQYAFPPLIDKGRWPLDYRPATVTPGKKADGHQLAKFDSSSNDATTPTNNKVIFNHKPTDAFDGKTGSAWLSLGHSSSRGSNSYEWIQAKVGGNLINRVQLRPWIPTNRGGYVAYISVHGKLATDAPAAPYVWMGGSTIASTKTDGTNIAYVVKTNISGDDKLNTIMLPATYRADFVRVTLYSLQDFSKIDASAGAKFRGALRGFIVGWADPSIANDSKSNMGQPGVIADYSEIVREALAWGGFYEPAIFPPDPILAYDTKLTTAAPRFPNDGVAGDWVGTYGGGGYILPAFINRATYFDKVALSDAFQPASSSLSNRVADTGQTWLPLAANGAYDTGTAGGMVGSVSAGARWNGLNLSASDVSVTFTLTSETGSAIRVFVRGAASSNADMLFITMTGGVVKSVAGVETTIIAAPGAVAGDTLTLTVLGSAVTASKNGTQYGSVTESAGQSNTWVGLRGSTGSSPHGYIANLVWRTKTAASGLTDLYALPKWITYSYGGTSTFQWANPTSDTRALQSPTKTFRSASTIFSATSMTVNLNFSKPYRGTLTLYIVDWENAGRAQTMVVSDDTGNRTVTPTAYNAGKYFSFPISVAAGRTVTVTITKTGAVNAVLSGIFLSADSYRGGVWGDIEVLNSSPQTPIGYDKFTNKSMMDVVTFVKEIHGAIFFVDDEGGAVFRIPNIWAVGSYITDPTSLSQKARISSHPIVLDERKNIISLQTVVDDSPLRSDYLVIGQGGDKDGQPVRGGYTPGFNTANPSQSSPVDDKSLLAGQIRVAVAANEPLTSDLECQRMAEMMAMQSHFQFRRSTITAPAHPGLHIDDQIKVRERITGDTYIHYVAGINTTMNLDSGQYTMQLTTNWLGDDPYNTWVFVDQTQTSIVTYYTDALAQWQAITNKQAGK